MEATTLVGSMHTFSQGYGYGGRVPTERNIPSTPSDPVRRYPVGATPREVTSSVLLQSRPNAADRNRQNIQHLVSGEYGSFYHDVPSALTSAPHSGRQSACSQGLCPSPIVSHRSQPQTSARASTRGGERSARFSARSSIASHQVASTSCIAGGVREPYAMMTERTKMKAMLSDLDSSFSRRNKYDLSTAVAGPPNDIAHLKLYGVTNYKNFEEGGRWAFSLRRSGKGVAPK